MNTKEEKMRAHASVSLSGDRWLGEIFIVREGETKTLTKLFFSDFDSAQRWASSVVQTFNGSEDDDSVFSIFRRTTGLHSLS
jgi:hypothetical protein